MTQNIITVAQIAAVLGLQPEDVTLPNGKVVKQIVWKPEHLPAVFEEVNRLRAAAGWGKPDSITIDGIGPTWLMPGFTHGVHPASASLAYPQGGPGATLPVSGVQAEGTGHAPDVTFKVTEGEDATTVEFALAAPQVDAAAVMAALVAPAVPTGKPVKITGRGPTAIAVGLAEAYAHLVPWVACFQPGTGYVVSISHSSTPLGTTFSS